MPNTKYEILTREQFSVYSKRNTSNLLETKHLVLESSLCTR